MSESMIDRTFWLIDWSHKKILQVTEDLSEAQFNWRPGPQAPPIGWHLWHIARYADRIQAFFPENGDGPRRQIWEEEELALRWELDVSQLGPIQGGEGMAHELAATLPQQIGQAVILDYAKRCFAHYEGLGEHLTSQDLERMRPSPYAYKITEDGCVVPNPEARTQLGSDLAWHLSHVNRHMGMIEAIRGAQELHGSATV